MFVARDKDGTCALYETRPVRDTLYGVFLPSSGDCEILEHVQFEDVTWENSPKEIQMI